ncbi:uncharacterized protein LOC130700195 [Daphnia carinata]|uniref:uncharacterized protein LOC130700195 n=1 Tax=Daphnia carinata TaxID=120202 RepID=UPI00257CBA13|nr:uncharacterized protein LOC130700195 [Daphnia carinata]
MESSSPQWDTMLFGIEAEKLVGIKAVWKYLNACRRNLVLETQKFESEKRLYESDRAAALKQIHLDLQSKFQCQLDYLVSKLDEASILLQSRKLKIANQSQYINLLEDKLRNDFGVELPVIMEEINETPLELPQLSVSLDSAFVDDAMELHTSVEPRKNEKLSYENRISQLEADVMRLEQERDQLKIQLISDHHPESPVHTEQDVLLPVSLQIKEQDDYKEPGNPVAEPFDNVNAQLDTSDSSGLETEDSTTSVTPPLDFLDANEEIVNAVKTSSSQFSAAQTSYYKILNNSLKPSQSAWIQTELLETCNTNLQCLEAMLFYLKSGYENAGLKKLVQDLMKKWVMLDAKLFLLVQKGI